MTPETLISIGSLLYGHGWRRRLSEVLQRPGASSPGVDYRCVRRWAVGQRPIPAWVSGELVRLVRMKVSSTELETCLESLENEFSSINLDVYDVEDFEEDMLALRRLGRIY